MGTPWPAVFIRARPSSYSVSASVIDSVGRSVTAGASESKMYMYGLMSW